VIVDPNQCTVSGASRGVYAVSGEHHSHKQTGQDVHPAARVLPGAEHHGSGPLGVTNNYLSLQDRTIDKNQFTQRIDFVQNSSSTWNGRFSYGNEHEITPALKLNGAKLETKVDQVMIGNTRTLSGMSSMNSGSDTTTSSTRSAASWPSSATSSRSWPFPG
jgi:hypothetical protein